MNQNPPKNNQLQNTKKYSKSSFPPNRDKIYYLLATGTLVSATGLDFMQKSGFTVVADRINHLRFLTHFRAVHRGQFFTTMKTTAVRKLLPESWGFMCPVHTPDGAPCGLLNHLTAAASVVCVNPQTGRLPALLASLGMVPLEHLGGYVPASMLPIVLDGRVLGGAPPAAAAQIAADLRGLKALASGGSLPEDLRSAEAEADVLGEVGDGTDERNLEGSRRKMRTVDRTLAARRKLRDRVAALVRAATVGSAPPQREVDPIAVTVPPSLEVAFIPPQSLLVKKVAPSTSVALSEKLRAAAAAAAADDDEKSDDEDSADERKEAPASSSAETDEDEAKVSDDLVGPFPGLFLSSRTGRLIRPVGQLRAEAAEDPKRAAPVIHSLELLGPLEQQFLDVAVVAEDIHEVGAVVGDASRANFKHTFAYTHMEISPMNMLSMAASLTPFSDLNQSPRNMYQCQMAKQTMGTPAHGIERRGDTKLYRLHTGQAPIVQNSMQSEIGMDMWPNGANAIVAVIAHTGMDMEDAMIVNKSAYERGFAHASVYKTVSASASRDDEKRYILSNVKTTGFGHVLVAPQLDADGLPSVGVTIHKGEPLYVVFDQDTMSHSIVKYKENEPAVVEAVWMVDDSKHTDNLPRKAFIRLRLNRNPVVGDKFSSRHGQKGVMSMLWPQADMPMTREGITPDVIINPHAFPSRMTIGMLVETMAGKAGALHARFQDSTPFRFGEKQKAADYFGEQLASAGYAYYGTEQLYSGATGEPLLAAVFIGVVYYQRLRHMINDKAQVRAGTGPVDRVTRQPVKGRKRGGGTRVGEMERDALIAHGTAAVLRDRLFWSSDAHPAVLCSLCGSMLSTHTTTVATSGGDRRSELDGMETGPGIRLGMGAPVGGEGGRTGRWTCESCKTASGLRVVQLPYVLRYLAHELASMNICLKFDL